VAEVRLPSRHLLIALPTVLVLPAPKLKPQLGGVIGKELTAAAPFSVETALAVGEQGHAASGRLFDRLGAS
jgi:hypothetical protein